MAENNIKLFEEFPPVSTEEWRSKIEADLKGNDFNKTLVWRTNEGFDVLPYYRHEDLKNVVYLDALPGTFPFVRGNNARGNNWHIRQNILVKDLKEANKKALEILQKGVNSLGFVFNNAAVIKDSDLETLLKDICLESIELNLVICGKNIENALSLASYIRKHYGEDANINASISIDPIGMFTRNGAFKENNIEMMKPMLEQTASLKKLSTISVNGKIFRDAGSSIVQELAFSLAIGAEYLSTLSEDNAAVSEVAKKMKFNFGIGSNYFMEIAKLRAARTLWAKIVETYKPTCDCEEDCTCDGKCEDDICFCAGRMNIHCENTIWNKTVYDPYVNMLRTQTEAMSAVLGGTNSLSVLPFNAIYEESTPFSDRVARNQQLLLKEEAHFDKIVDPAAGSYYIENLTDSIVGEVWKLFLELQDKGGYIASFKAGFIQKQVEDFAAKMESRVATRRENLLGTNQFPNFNEYMEKELAAEVFTRKQSKSDEAIAEPLRTYRGAQAFEILRAKTDAYAKNNKRPVVFMLTVGNLTMRKARAQFAANFFAVAGFEVKEGKGYQTVEEGYADAKTNKADVIVICSSDEEYAELTPALKKLLDQEILVVAGNPACKPELEAAGIGNFIHVRSNLLEELTQYQKQLIK